MRRPVPSPVDSRRGTAVVAVLALTVTIAMLSVILLQQGVSYLGSQSGSTDKKKALYLAEAGLAEALHSLRAGGSGNVGSENTPAAFGDGAFFAETYEDDNGLLLVEATGIAGGARATLENTIEPIIDSSAVLGVTGFGGVRVKAGATIRAICTDAEAMAMMIEERGSRELLEYMELNGLTAHDLMLATQAEPDWSLPEGTAIPDLPTQLTVSSNGSIEIESLLSDPVRILGNLAPGPDGVVELGPRTDVSGSTAPSRTQLDVPMIEVPELALGAGIHVEGTVTASLGPVESGHDSVRVGPGATLRIVGPTVLRAEQLEVEDGAVLEIDASNGPVEVFTDEGFRFHGDARLVNTTDDPRGLTVYVTEGTRPGNREPEVTLPESGTLHLGLVAPYARVEVPDHTTLIGNVVADELVIGSHTNLLFDNAMLIGDERDSRLTVVSWQVKRIPMTFARDLTSDLVEELKQDNGGSLPLPTDAGLDAQYGAIFLDPKGRERLYRGTLEGWQDKLDKGKVDTVVRILDPTDAADLELLERKRRKVGRVNQ